jgi:rhodanese-related sulfurtransferase
VSSKQRKKTAGPGNPGGAAGPVRNRRPEPTMEGRPFDRRAQIGLLIVVLVLGALAVLGTDYVLGQVGGSSTSAPIAPAVSSSANGLATPAGTPSQLGVVEPGRGGHWTSVSPDQLAAMLARKDFTLVNVKTPYIGEIDGTDLYLPYDQLQARASALPTDKSARVLVYCRSGVQSAAAAQTLLDLGYTNVWNLTGGMNAWTASGRSLVNKNRT